MLLAIMLAPASGRNFLCLQDLLVKAVLDSLQDLSPPVQNKPKYTTILNQIGCGVSMRNVSWLLQRSYSIYSGCNCMATGCTSRGYQALITSISGGVGQPYCPSLQEPAPKRAQSGAGCAAAQPQPPRETGFFG